MVASRAVTRTIPTNRETRSFGTFGTVDKLHRFHTTRRTRTFGIGDTIPLTGIVAAVFLEVVANLNFAS